MVGIVECRGRVLIGQRRAGQTFAGQWEFPGGKPNPSETPREALARELREELGINARVGEELHVARHRYPGAAAETQIHFLRASVARGEPRNLCFARIAWVPRGDLPRYDFLAGDRGFVARLARGEFI